MCQSASSLGGIALSQIIDAFPHLVWVANPQGEMIVYNQRWWAYVGDMETDSPSQGFWRSLAPQDRDRLAQDWPGIITQQKQELEADSSFYSTDLRLRHHTGQYNRFILRIEPFQDPEGEMQWVGTLSRASRLEQIEGKLQKEQQFLQALLENLSDGIVVCNEVGVLTLFNRAAQEFHGLPPHPIPAEQWGNYYNLFCADGKTPMPQRDIPLYRVLQGESIRNVEMTIVPKWGKPRTVLANGDPIIVANGQKIGAVVAMRDISDRKQAKAEILRLNQELERRVSDGESQLATMNSLYRSVLNSINEVIFQTDCTGCWTFLSFPWTKLTGYTIEETLNTSFLDYVFAYEDRADLMDLFQVLIMGEADSLQYEFRSPTKEGTFRWFEIYAQRYYDHKGEILGTSGAINDITEQKQTEVVLKARADELARQQEQIEQQNKELIKASQLKSQFLATMSHELRTPMNAIVGFSQMLLLQQYGELNERQQEMLDRINHNSEDLLGLLDEVLDFSKIEAGYLPIHAEDFDVTNLIILTIEELRSLAQKKDLNFYAQTPEHPISIRSDRSFLRRILVNLLSNAIKFTETGEVWVELQEVDENNIMIAVHDTGTGITESAKETIFEAFRQLDQTLTRKHSGTGLGLAIVKSLVERMQGTIQVKSQENQGSSFTINLPKTLAN
ncbi:PAS domain S-box protein [Spirulina sp. CS-785/01]|uniref:sensor histidine kinase n=1 Tax=Spirulina sp. CS-785/01 TaxID=3021716 RepID=UPI0023306221|nr:PAS domain S-box protein [Spirulina sp. CS-785/01]MDB9312358.1 PAS domain S-box protein [Spirulina sp. CS-785/01]